MQREKFSSQFADIDPLMYLTDSTNLSNVFFIYPALFSNFLADIFVSLNLIDTISYIKKFRCIIYGN